MGSAAFKSVVLSVLCPALNGNLVSIVLFMIVGSRAYALRDSQLLGLIAIFLTCKKCKEKSEREYFLLELRI